MLRISRAARERPIAAVSRTRWARSVSRRAARSSSTVGDIRRVRSVRPVATAPVAVPSR
jgi:hypothetical protein